jgi:hypothetical protein
MFCQIRRLFATPSLRNPGYYTPEISNAIFAMAEGDQATAGASVIGNLSGKPNIFFNNPFAQATNSGAFPFAVSNDQNMRDS